MEEYALQTRLTRSYLIFLFALCWSCTYISEAYTFGCRGNRRSNSLQMRGKSDDTPKKFTKSNLPSKDCIVCNRPFEWRKKWERCWDEVKYCSERCRRDGKGGGGGGGKEDTQSTKMKFNFESGRNSDSPNFINVFTTAAALPPISIQQREISNYNQKIKGILAFAAAIAGAEVLSYPSAALAAGTTRPTKKEIAEMFLDDDWESKATVLRKSSFRRLDEKPDSQYYESPRFVEHIDEKAVAALLSFHTKMLDDLSNKLYQKKRKVDVLDICSSWTSHLPISDFPVRTGANTDASNKVVGLGMNKAELDRNSQLSESLVQDLNVSPTLPFEKNSFDAILIQLSIDYLTKPLDLLSEANRVLRPGGAIFITFSNRVFIDKAIAGWTGKSDLDHIQTVGDYLHHSSEGWETPYKAVDLSPSDRTDPLYAVVAVKR